MEYSFCTSLLGKIKDAAGSINNDGIHVRRVIGNRFATNRSRGMNHKIKFTGGKIKCAHIALHQ